MTSSEHVVQLAHFLDADLAVAEAVAERAAHRTDTTELAVVRPAPARHRHPERATTLCSCRSPEPCFEHAEVPYSDYVADGGDTADGWAASVCQCIAPETCTAHPGERPLIARPPAWNDPHPDSPVARTLRRLDHDRRLGVLPGAEPGQGVDVLRFLTDHELGAWTEAILREHHRRAQRFADYRNGARSTGGMQ